jgi:hypothetical protein
MRIEAILAAAMIAPLAGDDKPFFDGRSLAGWRGQMQYWSVNNGAIVATSPGSGLRHNTFLCSERTYRDFELRFQVRLRDGAGNSGVQVRSTLIDPKTFDVRGPQCDIGAGYWGDLYGEHMGGIIRHAPKDKVQEAVKPADFNDYRVRCVGKRVTIAINGVTMIDDEFPTVPDEGIIAFQLHSGGPTEIVFRRIEFREFTTDGRR